MNPMTDIVCWLAVFGVGEHGDPLPACTGRIVRCHLIPKRVLKEHDWPPMDPRSFVWACGGVMGNGGHHGAFDVARTLRIPREAIPAKTEELALQAGLRWWLDREYGPRERVHHAR